ncbi:MAG: Gfo/Idh/MocA family oxidoreductase [Verrucomicrobiales bacterium]
MTKQTSRRNFLKAAGVAGMAGSLPFPSILRAANPGGKLNIAAIGGGGGKGESDLAAASEGNNVVAICDIDRERLAAALKKYNLSAERGFTDFRKMLDSMKEIDAVTVSTADHSHYPAAMHAIALGKHVCIQKPLTNTLWEAQQLHLAAKKKGVVTQMGNQGHTGEGIRNLKEWIDQGAIGKVKEIHVWTNRPIWPQGKSAVYTEGPVPEKYDWTSWLAANPDRPFFTVPKDPENPKHPICEFVWRGHTLYGAGAMGDMGCHLLDGPFFGCGLGAPTKIEAEAEEYIEPAWPKASTIKCHFPDKQLVLTWYDGGRKPPKPAALEESRTLSAGGFLVIGEKGAIYDQSDYCQSPRLLPESAHKDWMATSPKKTLERSTHPGNPQGEWTHAIKNGLKPGSNFDYSVPLTNLCLLGNLAMQAGKPIAWDAAKLTAKGMPEADKFIKREYRQGWDYSADKV